MRIILVASLFLEAGCTTTPPPPPSPRAGTTVNATANRTWDSVIEVFADRSIPIRNMERASGLFLEMRLRSFLEAAGKTI
jgi:hypothetical protein